MGQAANINEIPIIVGLIAITLFSFVAISADTFGVVLLVTLFVWLGLAIDRRHRAESGN